MTGTGTSAQPPLIRWLLALCVVLLVGVGAYWQVGTLGWTGWDDTAYVTKSPLMTAPDGLRRIWVTHETEQYYPLTFTLYWLEYRFFGADATGYHIVGLTLHLLNAALVFVFLRTLGQPLSVARVATALFALHPTQVITVAWIAEQKNTLAVAFMLMSMIAWVRSSRAAEAGASAGRWWYLSSLALFALGMLSKTAILGLPLALVALDQFMLGAPWKRSAVRAIPMLLLGGLLAAVTLAFEQKFVDKSAADWMPDLAQRLQIAGAAPWAYLGRLLWPAGLSLAYDQWGVGASSWHWWLPAAATIAGLGLVLWLHRRGRLGGHWVWAALHGLLLLGPTLGFIPFGNLAVTHTSDHFLYPASLAVFIAFALTADRLADVRPGLAPFVRIGCVALALTCAVLTFRLVPTWRSATTLWTRAVEVAPENYTARLGLAEGLMLDGKPDRAMEQYEYAVRLRPDWVDAHMMLGSALRDAGQPERAEASYRRALQLAPDNAVTMANLAGLLEKKRALPEALALYQRAVAIEPTLIEARMGLAQMHLGYSRPEDALPHFQAVVRLRGDFGPARLGVATCYELLGREKDALAACDEGLTHAPRAVGLLLMATRLRLAPADVSLRDWPRALRHARAAADASGNRNYTVLEALALAEAVNGDFAAAARYAALGADLARAAGDEPAMQGLRQSEADYRAGRLP
ncbi:MAG: tetratricopeptide repeat protein [Leptolyngbya sp. PLA1]|nr:tetratricopeptide repeat protein [Leptolyngbya sp. PLA1]